MRFDDVAEPDLRGIEAQIGGRLVELDLEREPGLGCPVTTFGSARGLVGEHPYTLEPVAGYPVGGGLKRPGVVQRCQSIAAERAAVEIGPEVHRGHAPVAPEAGSGPHQHRMAAAVGIEDLFAAQRDLHRLAAEHRELGGSQLMGERIALASESSAVGGGDHPDPAGGKLQDLLESAMDVVGHLGRGPQGELPGRVVARQGRVHLDRGMGVAPKQDHVFPDVVRRREPTVDVTELEGHVAMRIAAGSIAVDQGPVLVQRLLERDGLVDRLVLDIDESERPLGGLGIGRGHSRDRFAHMSDLVDGEDGLVLGDGQDPVADGEGRGR